MNERYKPLSADFAAFCAACFGVQSPEQLPDQQRLQLEDAFMVGALIGFNRAMGGAWQTCELTAVELRQFGDTIVARYEKAGLDTGSRRS